jgi:hypothetical protein
VRSPACRNLSGKANSILRLAAAAQEQISDTTSEVAGHHLSLLKRIATAWPSSLV